jgi:hypothetical protein
MTNHSLEMLDEHVSGQAEWRWLEANARRSGALFCPVFMNDRSVESQTSHVGRVPPMATVRDSRGPCRLHETVIGHFETFDTPPNIVNNRR